MVKVYLNVFLENFCRYLDLIAKNYFITKHLCKMKDDNGILILTTPAHKQHERVAKNIYNYLFYKT